MTRAAGLRVAVAAIAAAAALGLAGCASGPGAVSTDPPVETAAPAPGDTETGGAYPLTPVTDPSVLEYCPDIAPVHLDAAQTEVDDVYRCFVDAGTGAQVADRLTDPAAVLTAYAAEDEPLTDGACTMQFEDPAIVWVHAGSDIVAVRAPIDPCRFPQDAAVAALQAAATERVVEVPAS